MYVATATSAYEPEYYRALLAELEDNALKPKRTLATSKSIPIAGIYWRKFAWSSIVINSKLTAWVPNLVTHVNPIIEIPHQERLRVLLPRWKTPRSL